MSLDELEKMLRGWPADRRIYPEIWAEYYTALQVKRLHPSWEVKVTGMNRSSPDVTCFADGEEIRIQVKTAKWQKWDFNKPSKESLCSADAIFSKTQTEKGFDYLVFIIHKHGEIRATFVFRNTELKELDKRIMDSKPSYRICLVESIEKWEKYKESYHSQYPVYDIERDMVEHPEKYQNKWDKIKKRAS